MPAECGGDVTAGTVAARLQVDRRVSENAYAGGDGSGSRVGAFRARGGFGERRDGSDRWFEVSRSEQREERTRTRVGKALPGAVGGRRRAGRSGDRSERSAGGV